MRHSGEFGRKIPALRPPSVHLAILRHLYSSNFEVDSPRVFLGVQSSFGG